MGPSPITDPRWGDVEDDVSSTASRSLISLAGSMLVELSWTKLAAAWLLLVGFPSLMLGATPILAMRWASSITEHALAPLVGIWSLIALVLIVAAGWFGGRTIFRLGERSFWTLNSVAVEPAYAIAREGLRHLGDELLLPRDASQAQHGRMRAAMAALAGLVLCAAAITVAAIAWRYSIWATTIPDILSIRMAPALAANGTVLVAGYVAAAALFWGMADATLPAALDLAGFRQPAEGGRQWRIAHLSDLHVVGQRYGFRIECGRSGPRGNGRLEGVLSRLEEIHDRDPLDAIVISGDLTDAGRSAEWAELGDALARHPGLVDRMLVVPGNHDLSVVDGGNPARLDLPISPKRRLRQVRLLSMTCAIQGERVRVVDRDRRQVGMTLSEAVRPHAERIARFSNIGRPILSRWWKEAWNAAFPMIVPPDVPEGLGFILIDSNADTHFSFTNALGLVSTDQLNGIEIAVEQYPRASWVILLHHHVVEYPWRPHAFAERVGTALINANWFVRRLQPLADRVIVMHGHRHVDWLGACGGLTIVSAPSPVMDNAASYFHVHRLVRGGDRRLGLLPPERVVMNEPGRPARPPCRTVET
jgi:hypothetical protein